jgi:hypothetical protein
MLQLTNTKNGQITGVISSISLGAGGRINSEQESITGGTVDSGQLTLTFRSFRFGPNLAGTISGDTIQLQELGPNGNLRQWFYKRSSPAQFNNYAAELRLKANGIVLSANLVRRTQELRRSVQNAEKWISYAELHVQRIPGVMDHYQKIEDRMRSLVASERASSNSVRRIQMSVNVIQESVAGNQADFQVNQMWDRTIGDAGRTLSQSFASLPLNCDSIELKKYGATSQAIAEWQNTCQQAQAERGKFEPSFKHIMERRAELKSFQATAESHRQALVDEAGRIE